jgi:hypothetical protein
MSIEQAAPSTSGYIVHHLTNLHVGHGFWTLHLDTLIVSGVIGLAIFGLMAGAGAPAAFRRHRTLRNGGLAGRFAVRDTFQKASWSPRWRSRCSSGCS